MRRGHGYRLSIALSRPIPDWVPPPGAREDRGEWDEDGEHDGYDDLATVVRRDFTDLLLVGLDDAASQDLFEELALRGEDAEVLLVEEDADPEMPVPLYSTRWVRVSDQVFEQYAPLAQRRPA